MDGGSGTRAMARRLAAAVVSMAALGGCGLLIGLDGYERVDGPLPGTGTGGAGGAGGGGGAAATCGDGIIQEGIGEECDDGGTSDGDRCSHDCKLQEVLQITAGDAHTCALLSGGRVKCWGNNLRGQLGLGDTEDRGNAPGEMDAKLPFVDLGDDVRAKSLVAGFHHTCALLEDGGVKCWGYNDDGELGLGDKEHRGDQQGEMGENLPAVDLGTGRTALVLAAGSFHTCALLDDSSIKCWGNNFYGQLGLEDSIIRGDQPGEMGDGLPPVYLGVFPAPTALAAGDHHTCALSGALGVIKCWGNNAYGQLGLGDTMNRGTQPMDMGGALPSVDLGSMLAVDVAGGGSHTCALLSNATVKCWGNNINGQLGLGDTMNRGGSPTDMGSALPWVALGTGYETLFIVAASGHNCAHVRFSQTDDRIKCWGQNSYGQLGLQDMIPRGDGVNEMGDNLAHVELGATMKSIAAGRNHTCAALVDGSMKCWGLNSSGQLGLGDTAARGEEVGEMGDDLPTVKLFSDAW